MIDVHAHLFPTAMLGAAGDAGPRVIPTAAGGDIVSGAMTWSVASLDAVETAPEKRVASMDASGIDLQVVSVSPLWLFHHIDAATAVRFAAIANDATADYVSAARGRLRFMAQLPVQDPSAAAAELRRAVQQLGAVGAYFASDARQALDDRELDPVYKACEELDVPLFIHAAMPGIDGPPGDPRLDRWIGTAVLGYPLEDTIAVHTFLFSDLLDRHPRLDVCFAHGGGAIPMLWGRLEAFAGSARSPIDQTTLRRRLDRLWFDNHVHFDAGLELLERVVNREHIVFGSNFGGWDSAHTAGAARGYLDANARALLRL